ncbi:hypothetical protein [Rhodanobacter sp. DHB23]|uniref:hypothetical protein n=1 Tax=Rhodanobacter sp. DHB23 TaxID=2775923 RepID=UPI00177B0385|nr:hypothetical protein [Rhodanobacter sp. DHB23]MBD8872477.1 hypothetical protein [Rhodanobacter sp. DHB23]
MIEFLKGMLDGFRKGKAKPWSVVVAGYFTPFTGLMRSIFSWIDQATVEAQRRHDQKIADRHRST